MPLITAGLTAVCACWREENRAVGLVPAGRSALLAAVRPGHDRLVKKVPAAAAALGVLAVLARRLGPKMAAVNWQERVEAMPDDAPPKWLFRNITAIRQDTAGAAAGSAVRTYPFVRQRQRPLGGLLRGSAQIRLICVSAYWPRVCGFGHRLLFPLSGAGGRVGPGACHVL